MDNREKVVFLDGAVTEEEVLYQSEEVNDNSIHIRMEQLISFFVCV